MKSISLSFRLWVMILIAAASLLVVGAVGLHSASSLGKAIAKSNHDTIPAIAAMDGAQSALLQIQVGMFAHLINIADAKKDAFEKDINTQKAALEKHLAAQEQLVDSDEERKLMADDRASVKAFLEILPSILALSRKDMQDAARHVIENELLPASNRTLKALQAHAALNTQLSQTAASDADLAVKRGHALSLSVILLGILVTGGVGILLVRKISRSVQQLRTNLLQVQENKDFTLRIPVESQDELGQIGTTLNQLFDTLQASLLTLSAGVQHTTDAASSVARSASEGAASAETQSDAASSMAAAMEEMTVSIGMVGERASEAHSISRESVDLAAHGNTVIRATLDDIRDISASVNTAAEGIRKLGHEIDGISSVVGVIRDVADQTNLLALNAAIEAARAGEQGRGFAVVADEVRKLAERTATSTREIAAIVERVRNGADAAIGDMSLAVGRVDAGVERTHDAEDAIAQIGRASERAMQMVTEISHAIREQGSSSTAIAQRVEQIAQMAEEASETASSNASIASNLDSLGNEMRQAIEAYRLTA